MISSFALTLLITVLTLAALMLLKDLIWFLKSLKYIKQGIPVRYFPVIGSVKYLENPDKEDGMDDFRLLFQKRDQTEDRTEKLILMGGLTTEAFIFLNDEDLIKEFFQKETQVCCTDNSLDFPPKKSFLFSKDRHKVQNERAIFAEIFYPENLEKQTPQIRAIVQRHLKKLKKSVKEAKTVSGKIEKKFVEIDLKSCTKAVIVDIVSFVLFGGEIPEVEGVPMVNQIDATIQGWFKNRTSLLHVATGGLSTKLGLDSEFNRIEQVYQKLTKTVKEVVSSRDSSEEYALGSNVVDLLILKNRQLKAAGKHDQVMSLDKIAENIFVMIFARMDTSRNLTESALYKLSFEPELQSKLRDSVRRVVVGCGGGLEYQKYDQSGLLNLFIKESLRLYSPILFSFNRKILRDFELGQYKFSKGDNLIVPFRFIQVKPECFDQPREFDLRRYKNKKKIKEPSRSVLVPFSAGKRACVGKNLADIMIKVILCNFLDQFELEGSATPIEGFFS